MTIKQNINPLLSIIIILIVFVSCTYNNEPTHQHTSFSFDTIKKQYYTLNKLDDQYEYLERVDQRFVGYKGHDLSCWLLVEKCIFYDKIGQPDSLVNNIDRIIDYSKIVTDSFVLANAYQALGTAFYYQNNFIQSADYYMDALSFIDTNDHKFMASINNNIGMLYGNLGDFSKAYEYFLNGLQALGSNSGIGLHGTLNSNLYAAISNLDSLNSLEIFNKSLAIFIQIQDSSSISRLYNNHSYILAKTNQIDSALITNEYALNYSVSDQNNMFNALYQKGFLFYNKLKDYEAAEETFLECLDIKPKYRDLRFEFLIYDHLSKIEQKRDNYDKAFFYFNKHVGLKDSLTGNGIEKDILSIELQSQIKEQELQASILQKENEIKQRKSYFQRTILFVILIILLLLILIIYILNKNLQKKNKVKELEKIRLEEQIIIDHKAREVESLRQKEKLNRKNKELTAFSLKLIAKNDVLKKISKLSNHYYDKDLLERQYYNELSSIIDNNANVEKEWEYFKVLFEKVHQDFFKKLVSYNANLTPLDYKLSAFIKVNMSTREIAQILNIEVDSVTMAKHRLKKKIGLEKSMRIDQFIQHL